MDADDGFDAFLEAAWAEHGEQAHSVAQRLTDSTARIARPEQLVRYAALVAHVMGEHLGEWERGRALLRLLHGLPACRDDAAAQAAVARHQAALLYAGGDTPNFDALANDDRVAALAGAAGMLAGRNEWARAIATLDQALHFAEAGLVKGSPALRALAVAGNNMAAALEEKPDRDAHQTRAMLRAAQVGLTYWQRAGTWLEEERAEYRLAKSCLQAGEAAAAVAAALRCLSVCEAHGAPAFERFFGHALLALAQRAAGNAKGFDIARAQALHWHALVDEDERAWCEGDRGALDA